MQFLNLVSDGVSVCWISLVLDLALLSDCRSIIVVGVRKLSWHLFRLFHQKLRLKILVNQRLLVVLIYGFRHSNSKILGYFSMNLRNVGLWARIDITNTFIVWLRLLIRGCKFGFILVDSAQPKDRLGLAVEIRQLSVFVPWRRWYWWLRILDGGWDINSYRIS